MVSVSEMSTLGMVVRFQNRDNVVPGRRKPVLGNPGFGSLLAGQHVPEFRSVEIIVKSLLLLQAWGQKRG